MISFARQGLILRPIEKRLYLFADERSEGENKPFFQEHLPVVNNMAMKYWQLVFTGRPAQEQCC